jgi:hypothetical protein
MTENLILLGSGASMQFGFPTIRGLVDSFEKHLEKLGRNDSANEILALYSDIKENLQKVYDNVDLESIFSVLYQSRGILNIVISHSFLIMYSLNIRIR